MLLALKINISPLLLFLCEKLREVKLLTWVFPTRSHPVIVSSPGRIWDFSCSPPSRSTMPVFVGTAGLRSQAEMPVSCSPALLSAAIAKPAITPKLLALKGARPQMSFQVLISSVSSSLTWTRKLALQLCEQQGCLSGLRMGLEVVTLLAYVHRRQRSCGSGTERGDSFKRGYLKRVQGRDSFQGGLG